MPHDLNRQEWMQVLARARTSQARIPRPEFTLSDNTTDSRSKIAEYRVRRPMAINTDKDMELAIPAGEEITSDGSGTTSTYSLSYDAVDGPNTESFILFADGSKVAPGNYSVDYANDEFDYADDGTTQTLDVWYTVRTAANVEIEKVKPDTGSTTSLRVFRANTNELHTKNRHENPTKFTDVGGFDAIIPQDWYIRVYLDASWAFRSGTTTNSNDLVPENMVLGLPIRRHQQSLPGLADRISQEIARR